MVKAILVAARPRTLSAALVPVWLGCAWAWHGRGVFDLVLALCTLGSALAIQVATNFFNDALDFRKGADTGKRLGPVRVTASGLLDPRAVMLLGAAFLGVACLLAWPLVAARGWPILAIGLPSLYFAFGYTGGPLPLAYRGLGEFFVLVFFGWVAVAGTVFVQTGDWDPFALVLGTQVGLLSVALIAINNLRDVEEDRTTGKRTLAVRFGVPWARRGILSCFALAFALGAVWGATGHPGAALAPLLALPTAWRVSHGVLRHEPGPSYNRLLAGTGLALLLFAAGFHGGLALDQAL